MKHGFKKTRFYTIWHHMKQRCKNEKRKDFYLYGGKGIKFCDEWEHFLNFKNDMYKGYLNHVEEHGEKNTTLDRINTNGNYEPNNCRWATIKEQLKNRNAYNMKSEILGIDPNGKTYHFNNQKRFALEHNLDSTKISKCLNNKQKTHKNWIFKRKEETT